MLLVSIDGVMQVPGIDYHTGANNSIGFSTAPRRGSLISIQGKNGTLANIQGDGSTYLFHFTSDIQNETVTMLEQAYKLRDVPAVADMLKQLQVVVELAKVNSDTIR